MTKYILSSAAGKKLQRYGSLFHFYQIKLNCDFTFYYDFQVLSQESEISSSVKLFSNIL